VNVFDEVLLRSVQDATQNTLTIQFGRVKTVGEKSLTVTIGGVDVPGVAYPTSYNAKQGEWAWLLRQGTLLVAIGATRGTVNAEVKGNP
jgi:hypothetical protein